MNKQTLNSKKHLVGVQEVENLPELSQRCSLSPAQVEQYRQDGHLIVPQALAPADVAAYRPFLVEVANRELAKLNDSERAVGTSGSTFVYDLREVHQAVWRLITSVAIAKIAAELLEVDSVRLLHYNCFFKPPQGLGTPWHQDCLYIPLNTDKVIAAWIPLVELSPNMGPLTFASGSHRTGFFEFANTNKYLPERIVQMLEERGLQLTSVGSMAVGDVSFHSSFTLHSAPNNFSDRMREVIAISYYADGACIGEPENFDLSSSQTFQTVKYREHFLNQYFSGLQRGDLASSPTNPVVYQKNQEF
jgi:ectoine hydroxylase-related dioxygenase (phytanoyl-CoA dioxygenase family)